MNKKSKPRLLRITTVPISLKLLLTNQMKFMRNQGMEVIMISAGGKEIKDLVTTEECPHLIVPFTRTISPLQDLICLWQLIKIIWREKPDIVHTHTPKAGLLGMLAAKVCGVPLKMHTIAGLPLMTASGAKKKLLIFIEKLTYWSADYILPNSNSIMSFVKKHQFTTDEKLDMIGGGSSNGIDLNRFSSNKIKEDVLDEIKGQINYDSSNKYLLSVGRVVKDKGIIELVDTFVSLKQRYENLKLIIVGPLEEQRAEELLPQRISHEIENNPNIIHINWSDEVEYFMHLANILIHASYREGFPNVPLQAGAMECPVICSEIPGNIDIVTNNQTGLYFNVGDSKQLEERIAFALDNEDTVKSYASRLRKEIQSKFSRLFIHTELLKFYQRKLSE